MGQELGLELREDSLMTKVMLKQEQDVIDHIEEEKIEVHQPINQMGDTLLHYAAYKSLKKLIEYLLEHDADPYQPNNRSLAPVDLALPHIREWLIKQHCRIQEEKANQSSSQTGKKETNGGRTAGDARKEG